MRASIRSGVFGLSILKAKGCARLLGGNGVLLRGEGEISEILRELERA
jgi:hypothetical protein